MFPSGAQEIDPSMFKDLSPEQIKKYQELYAKRNGGNMILKLTSESDEKDFDESMENNESLVLKETKKELKDEEEFNLEKCLEKAFTNKEIRKCNEKKKSLQML